MFLSAIMNGKKLKMFLNIFKIRKKSLALDCGEDPWVPSQL